MRGKSNPMDITTLSKIPEHLTYPLRRDGVDPVAELAEQRAIDPVHKLGSTCSGIDAKNGRKATLRSSGRNGIDDAIWSAQ